jgi:predicted metallo-beta-lactamase superfamily hydrolase
MHDPENRGEREGEREKKEDAVHIKVALIAHYIVDHHLPCVGSNFL